jgi:hypothetical protein
MFFIPASLLTAVREWFEGDDSERRSAWDFGGQWVNAPIGHSAFALWLEWERHGSLPRAGGWLDQPLLLLTQIRAIDLTVTTMRQKQQEKFDWNKWDATQVELVWWLDNG